MIIGAAIGTKSLLQIRQLFVQAFFAYFCIEEIYACVNLSVTQNFSFLQNQIFQEVVPTYLTT